MPTTETTPRTRVSAYQARIERTLTDVFIEVPVSQRGGDEWTLVSVAHTNGYASCDLCGHTPIKRLFFIESRSTGTVKMIGSECARNYVAVDLVAAYERSLNRQQSRLRRTTRRAEAQANRMAMYAAAREERAATSAVWATEHATEVAWLRANHSGNAFLSSVFGSFEQFGTLSARQLECVRTNMNRTPRTNAASSAATPDQVPHIYNGTYTMDDGANHLTFAIYTATRGPLQGKRIVKRSLQYGQFQGFAFVNSDGTLGLWRRFAEQADELYVRWARILLAGLNDRTNDQPGIDRMTIADAPTHTNFTVQRTRTCRRCNRNLTVPTSIESGIGPECARRDASANRTSVADAHQGGTGAVAPAPTPRWNGARQEQQRLADLRSSRLAGTTTQLELSELGSGMLQ